MNSIVIKDRFGVLHAYMTYLFFFLVPMSNSILPLALGLWTGSWVIWRALHYKERFPLPNKALKIGVILFLGFNLLNYLSAFWGFDPPSSASIMEHRLSFFIISLVLLVGLYPKLELTKLIKAYFYGSLATIAFFSFKFILAYLSDGVIKYQLDVLGIDDYINDYKHPAYMSLNLVLSFFLYLTTLKTPSKKDIAFSVFSYVLFVSFIFFSKSRAGLFNVILLTGGLFFYLGKSYLGLKKTLLLLIPVVLIFGGGVTTSAKFKKMFDNSEHVAVRAPRKILWKTALEMTKDQAVFGYGIGSSKQEFVKECKDNGLYHSDLKQYNVHNQFLEIILESGIVSLLLFFFALYYFLQGMKARYRWVGAGMYVIFAFALFFESMLLRIAGISSFVAMLLFVSSASYQGAIIKTSKSVFTRVFIGFSSVLFITVLLLVWKSSTLGFVSEDSQTYAYKDYTLVEHADLPQPLPENLEGREFNAARFDMLSEPSLWSGNAFLLNKIAQEDLNSGERLIFSAYCYVSTSFDGDWVRISIDREGSGTIAKSDYNLDKKGTWQKLEVLLDDETGIMPAYFFFSRSNCNSFDDLKGYVLFAYPQFIITKK